MTKDDNASDAYLSRLLEYIFHCIVLVYGLDDVTSIKNVERLKKEIKVITAERIQFRGFAMNKNQKIRFYHGSGWLGPGLARNFVVENHPKIALNQY